ncbi:MAG: T9SS type A sorting domain-containing protein [Flavobacteriales bacterium]|nr:T9SS type A sorting domain-containing protein [Flavobacteriales bacterium]
MLRFLLAIPFLSYLSMAGQLSDCEPIFSSTILHINEIRARIGLPNNFFTDSGDAGFEVPAGDSIHSIYAHSDWMGGMTADGQVHLAANSYFSGGGSDFFSGPLTNDGSAITSEEMCESYAELYTAKRLDAIIHQEYFDRMDLVDQGADPDILNQAPFENGYSPPAYFYTWPANNPHPDYDFYLAPFFDRDQDGIYDPDAGDYPGFDLEGDCSCHHPDLSVPEYLQGHEAVWQVYHDSGLHTESGGVPLGVEVHCTTFGFNTCSTLDQTLFQRKRFINRSSNTYLDTYIGQWMDTDLGCPTDDYVGCDVQRGLAYTYNGDGNDADCDGVQGYGQDPPIFSFQFLAGPYADADGLDNPFSSDLGEILALDGIPYTGLGIGYGDGIVDNERLKMSRFTYYNRGGGIGFPINVAPDIAIEFYYFLSGRWLNGQPVTFGGDGTEGDILTSFMYPGASDPLGYATQGASAGIPWFEDGEPGDRRLLPITGPFTFEPGEVQEIVTAFNHTGAYADAFVTFNNMRIEADHIQTQFEYCFQLAPPFEAVESFSYAQDENTFEFSLPYYYPYEATWNIDGYLLYGNSIEFTFTEEGEYEVCVEVISCNSPEQVCETIHITTMDIPDLDRDELIVVYPNPTDVALYIQSNRIGKEIRKVEIFDVGGRLHQDSPWGSDTEYLELSPRIRRGFYSVLITYEDGMQRSASFLKK